MIGKEGSTEDGSGFIQRLWADANAHFWEVAHLAKRDANGDLVGIWGAMSNPSRGFLPWQDGFTKGLYLAGVECVESAQPPEGWTKWVIPGYEYLSAQWDRDTLFSDMLQYLQDNQLTLAGAVHDFTCPKTGRNYMFFPIRKL